MQNNNGKHKKNLLRGNSDPKDRVQTQSVYISQGQANLDNLKEWVGKQYDTPRAFEKLEAKFQQMNVLFRKQLDFGENVSPIQKATITMRVYEHVKAELEVLKVSIPSKSDGEAEKIGEFRTLVSEKLNTVNSHIQQAKGQVEKAKQDVLKQRQQKEQVNKQKAVFSNKDKKKKLERMIKMQKKADAVAQSKQKVDEKQKDSVSIPARRLGM